MRLTELDPKWTNPIPLADGIGVCVSFLCPKHRERRHLVYFWPIVFPYAFDAPHAELCTFLRKWLDDRKMPTWTRNGPAVVSFDQLTLAPSIANKWIGGEECCHMTITDGEVLP